MKYNYQNFLFCFLFVVGQLNVVGQPNRNGTKSFTRIDSLKIKLNSSIHDSTRCNILNELSETEPDEILWPAEKSKYRNGDFVEESDTDAPFTHVIFDITTQVVAIAKKTSILPTTKGIANALAKFLNSFSVIQKNELKIEVESIWNPEDFLASISDAYAVSKYWVRVKHPNAFDVNQDFLLPMEKTLANADGKSIKSEIKGKDLKKDSLEDYTRSCASKGNEAGATIQKTQRSKRKNMVLGKNPVTVDGDEQDDSFLKTLIKEIREAYKKVRYGKQQN